MDNNGDVAQPKAQRPIECFADQETKKLMECYVLITIRSLKFLRKASV